MDEDARTLYCGNLSEKVTEDILYELFIQGGPVQKIIIPKDRDGKQRSYGFITYKHMDSVEYALHLFGGTMLYNRTLNMKLRNNTESQQAEQSLNPVRNMNHMLELGQQMILGHYLPQTSGSNAMFGINISQDTLAYPRQLNSSNEDRRRYQPYQKNRKQERDRNRERNRDREREKDNGRNRERNHNDHYRDERAYYNRDNNYRSNEHFRYNDNRKRWTYH